MNITTTKVDSPQCLVIVVDGKIDGAGAIVLEAMLMRAVDSRDPADTRLVLDLAAAPFISSAGLRVVISAAKRLRALPGGDLRLASPSTQMLDVLELAGLLSVFRVYESQQQAIQSFETPVR